MEQRMQINTFEQRQFFQKIKAQSNLSWKRIALLCNVGDRTLRDWANGKYTPTLSAITQLSKKFSIAVPQYNILDPYWYIPNAARRGGYTRYKLYGAPGTIDTRRQAGIKSQLARKNNPEKYRLLNCKIRKQIKPLTPNTHLAELFGILLGDGGITHSQVKVTLHRIDDAEYALYVAQLMETVFGEKPGIHIRKNVFVLTISGVNYIEALEQLGLKRGNKVKNQIDIPTWILKNTEYARLCVRGLMDTDGGVYFHHHMVNGKPYVNFGLTFTNYALPITNKVYEILKTHNFSPSLVKLKRIYIYKLSEIQRYFSVFGSHNPKHLRRVENYLKTLVK
jgi:transcriptional regulator with XRE-family HTH domain